MAQPENTTLKNYQAQLRAERKLGGDENQSHWLERLAVVMRRAEAEAKKPTC